jgi:T5SS/PEP-CTERM-associated repeat protein
MTQNETTWTAAAADMAWIDAQNWSAGTPLAGVNAVFSDGGTWTISLAPAAQAAPEAGTLLVTADHVTFTAGSLAFSPTPQTGSHPTYDMQLRGGAAVTVARSAHLIGAQTAEVEKSAAMAVHGAVTEEYALVAGKLTIAGKAARWTNGESGLDIIGDGHLTITAGARLDSSNPEGSLEIEGFGATATITGPQTVVREPLLFVGEFQAGGALAISGGAAVYDDNGDIGGSGDGTAVVTGPGTTWVNRSGIFVGGQVPSSAALSILDGAQVSFGSYGLQLEGTLSLDGSATLTGKNIVSGGGIIEAEPGGPARVTLTQNIEINYDIYNAYDSETTYMGSTGGAILDLKGRITAGYAGQPEILDATGGTVILRHAGNSYGATEITGAMLELAARDAAGTGTMSFIGGNRPAELRIDKGIVFGNQIAGFGAADKIDAAGIQFSGLVKSWTSTSSGGQLSLSDGRHSLALNFDGTLRLASFGFVSDGHGGTIITHR